jgi:hypothetical protein
MFSNLKSGLTFYKILESHLGYGLPSSDEEKYSLIWTEFKGCSNDNSLKKHKRKNYAKEENFLTQLFSCMASLYYHTENVKKLESELNKIIEEYKI